MPLKMNSFLKSIYKMDFISWFNGNFRPYYHKETKELIELRRWAKEVERNGLPDNVWVPPKDFKRPSLYHPLYVNGMDVAVKKQNYSHKDDSLRVPIKDMNPNHDNNLDIKSAIKPLIKNKVMPVNTMLFGQNDNTMELLCHVQAGAFRFNLRENGSNERKMAKNNSRIRMDERDGETAFCHLVPVGFCGSESDERTGIAWWSSDNKGPQKRFENKWDKATENFYWLTRIEKIKNKRGRSGLSWDYYVYDYDGELIDSMVGDMNHLVDDGPSGGVWDEGTERPWLWHFGVDEPVEDTSDADSQAMKNYVYSTTWYGFDDSKVSPTTFATGLTPEGEAVIFDSATPEAPHMILAGTTGSGKSVWENAKIFQLLVNATPQQIQFCFIDPNNVEFNQYQYLPYNTTDVITDLSKAKATLEYFYYGVCKGRANMFSRVGVRNLTSYNKWVRAHKEEAETLQFGFLADVYIIIDEMASLVLDYGDEVIDVMKHIAAEGRKFGVHLDTATQRPSVDVIPGTLKANFPLKIGMSVNTSTDAQTIMEYDYKGRNPDQLKGNGENIAASNQRRVYSQGFYVSDEDSKAIINSLRYLHYGLSKDFDKSRKANDDNNPLYDISKHRSENIEEELVRLGLYKIADNGELEAVKKG